MRVVRAALALTAVTAAALAVVLALHSRTAEDIRANEQAFETAQLRALVRQAAPAAALPPPRLVKQTFSAVRLRAVYPLYEDGRLAAVLVRADALDGYNGEVAMAMAFMRDGGAPLLRILQHRETPGIADFLDDTPEAAFDGVTGATRTASALTQATQQTAQWLIRCMQWDGEELLSATC